MGRETNGWGSRLGCREPEYGATGNQYAAGDQHGAGEVYAADGVGLLLTASLGAVRVV